ncbi:hypothetical protein B0H14DRAFT_3454682 [Mycena olivaceomarginata]|nr:hypothetical protein B0H14DRAFT_3454682 [Mycena olivaceomarginata]
MHIPVCHTPGAKLDHANRDRSILDDRATSWEPSVIVEGAWVRTIPSPVVLLDSHHSLEPPAYAFAAHSILLLHLPRRRRIPHNAHETHHIYSHLFLPSSPEAPCVAPSSADYLISQI